jgi:hypothetical protein
MSATCTRPGLAQVCDGSATRLVADPGLRQVGFGLVWSGIALVEFGLKPGCNEIAEVVASSGVNFCRSKPCTARR